METTADTSCNRSGPSSNKSIEFLARFTSVTIGQGEAGPTRQPSKFADDNILDVARRVKLVDPSVYTIAHFNSVLDRPMYRFHEQLAARPDLWSYRAPDDHGHRAPTRTHWDQAFAQPTEGMLSVNFTVEEGRDLWASQCTNMTATGAVDGCFSDRAAGFPSELDPSEMDRYSDGHMLVHQQLQAQLSAAGAGVVIGNDFYPQVRAMFPAGPVGPTLRSLRCAASLPSDHGGGLRARLLSLRRGLCTFDSDARFWCSGIWAKVGRVLCR